VSVDPEAAYYQGVEDFFVSRRGDPLFLSNADWLLIRRWRKAGLPLRIVLRGIQDALESHAHSWGRDKKVGSLRYCEAEVDVARERWERALAGGADSATDLGASLEAFATALEHARGLGPRGLALSRELASRLRVVVAQSSSRREAEETLGLAEGELVAAIRKETDAERLRAIELEVDRALAPYRARMPGKVFADLRGQSITRQLLAGHDLPRLSLFDL
jgi:hypothetical protein